MCPPLQPGESMYNQVRRKIVFNLLRIMCKLQFTPYGSNCVIQHPYGLFNYHFYPTVFYIRIFMKNNHMNIKTEIFKCSLHLYLQYFLCVPKLLLGLIEQFQF